MVKVKSISGEEKEVNCIGCELVNGTLKGSVIIIETKDFLVQQDFETPIPGFLIISSKHHIKGIENLSETQRKEFIELVYNIRKALTELLSIEYVYIIQKEDSIINRSHFHVWLFPRYPWMNEFGGKIESVTKIIEYARKNMKNKENISEVEKAALKLKEFFRL